MPVSSPTELPLWGQITGALVFIGGAFGVIRQAWRTEIKPKPPAGDAVLISGAFADTKPIRDLTEAIDRLNRSQAESSRDVVNALGDVERETRRVQEEMVGVRTDIARGVRVVASPGG